MKFSKLSISMLMLSGTLLWAPSALAGGDKSKAMDTDGDGLVSASEHETGARGMFERMDADKDGNVTAAEMDAAHAAMGKEKMQGEMSSTEKIGKMDTNGDGKMSAEEHSTGSRAMFEKMDTDKNGSLSKAESDAGHKKMMSKN